MHVPSVIAQLLWCRGTQWCYVAHTSIAYRGEVYCVIDAWTIWEDGTAPGSVARLRLGT